MNAFSVTVRNPVDIAIQEWGRRYGRDSEERHRRVHQLLVKAGIKAGEEGKMGREQARLLQQYYRSESGCLFRLLSMLNHSCEPNAEVRCDFTTPELELVLTEDVREGEELVIKYGKTGGLKGRYGFECKCRRCK
jgi:SET domain-containing protein